MRPLDFLVVSDHSDGMGFFPQLMSGDPGLLATPRVGGGTIKSTPARVRRLQWTSSPVSAETRCPRVTPCLEHRYRSAWREIIKAADDANDPGRFTYQAVLPPETWPGASRSAGLFHCEADQEHALRRRLVLSGR